MSDDAVPAPTPEPPAAPAPEPDRGPPAHRWNDLKSRLEAAEQRAAESSARAAKLEKRIEELRAAGKASEQEWSERLDLVRHGFDDVAGQAAARAAYAAAGDDKPESLGAYIDALKEAAGREEGAQPLPRWAQPYLAGPPPEAPKEQQRGIRSIQPPSQPPAANGSVSDEGLRAIMATGDREQLIAALSTRGVKWP